VDSHGVHCLDFGILVFQRIQTWSNKSHKTVTTSFCPVPSLPMTIGTSIYLPHLTTSCLRETVYNLRLPWLVAFYTFPILYSCSTYSMKQSFMQVRANLCFAQTNHSHLRQSETAWSLYSQCLVRCPAQRWYIVTLGVLMNASPWGNSVCSSVLSLVLWGLSPPSCYSAAVMSPVAGRVMLLTSVTRSLSKESLSSEAAGCHWGSQW
jgi:hypothetical protein